MQDGYDLSRPAGNQTFKFDPALVLTITALLLDSEAVRKAMTVNEPPDRLPASMTQALSLVLKDIISQRLRAYNTTIAEDIALLEDSAVQGRRRMAIEVRLGEKEILAMAAAEVTKQIARRDADVHADHAKKRRIEKRT